MDKKFTFLRAVLFFMLLAGFSANAQTITVTNSNDSGPGSLRQAVIDAMPGDIIVLMPPPMVTLLTLRQTLALLSL